MGDWKQQRRMLKQSIPRLAALYSGNRLMRELERTVRLLGELEAYAQLDQTKENGQTVVIHLGRTYIPTQVCTELIFALKLRQRGYRVYLLYDDGVLLHHDTLTMNYFRPFQTGSFLKRRLSLALLKRLPLSSKMLEPYSRYYDKNTSKETETLISSDRMEYDGVDLSQHVEASLVRFFLSAPDDKFMREEPHYQRAKEMFVKNCIISHNVAKKVYEQLKPELMITSHGFYSTWGLFLKHMMDRGVRCISYNGNGYSINSLDLAVNDIAANKSDNGFFDHFVNEVVTEPVIRQDVFRKVDSMIMGRMEGSAADIEKLGVKADYRSHPATEKLIRLKSKGKRVFGLFPNVMWDSATTRKQWDRVFSSPVQWLVETVKYILASNDKALVIRIHPAEYVWMPVRKSIVDILRCYLGDEVFSDERLVIIPSHQRLSSYSLFEYLAGGIVYNGTIGLEIMYQKVPLIIGAKAAYSDKGFTYDIANRDDYFDSFDQTNHILHKQNENLELLKLFMYEYFFLHGVPVKFMSKVRSSSPNWEGDPRGIWWDDNVNHIISTIVGENKYFQRYSEIPAMV